LQGSVIAEDVFHGFIAAAPVKIHSGSLQLAGVVRGAWCVERYLPPFGQYPSGQANRRLVAQAPGQKGAIIPSSPSHPGNCELEITESSTM
jgi:hypothetical protein